MLTRQEIDALAARLVERKRLLEDEARTKFAESRALTADSAPGEVVDGGDVAQSNLLAEVDLAEAVRDVAEVQQIQAAQRRIAEGTYGICESCGIDIPFARMQAAPTASRCTACQELAEHGAGR
jgi:RNA polymerase-binding protein DksA